MSKKSSVTTPDVKARVARSTAKKNAGSIPKDSQAARMQRASDKREANKSPKGK